LNRTRTARSSIALTWGIRQQTAIFGDLTVEPYLLFFSAVEDWRETNGVPVCSASWRAFSAAGAISAA
jgi:hypothetical protein